MKQNSYTENAIVVLNDRDTWSMIQDCDTVLFKNPDPPYWIRDFGGAKCLDWHNETGVIDDDRTFPQDLVSTRISIKFLLDFYLKYRDQSSLGESK